jgi:excisionase family DNA binding protein
MEASTYLAPSEAARSLGVSAVYVRKLMEQGKLRFVWTSLGRLVEPQSIEEVRSARAVSSRTRRPHSANVG